MTPSRAHAWNHPNRLHRHPSKKTPNNPKYLNNPKNAKNPKNPKNRRTRGL